LLELGERDERRCAHGLILFRVSPGLRPDFAFTGCSYQGL
jgi:hypothetical protein